MEATSSSSPRSLRPRRERKSLAHLFQAPNDDEDDQDADGSTDEEAKKKKKLPIFEEPVSDSEYDPGEAAGGNGAANPGADDDDDDEAGLSDLDVTDEGGSPAEDEGSDNEPRFGASSSSRTLGGSRNRLRVNGGPTKSQMPVFTSFNFTQKRPGNRVSAPNISATSNRNRPSTMHVFPGSSRRLAEKPSPFSAPRMVTTNGLEDSAISTRFAKAWGCSVFPGPTWEITEDLGFYKEISYDDNGEHVRPVVHEEVNLSPRSFEVLDSAAASKYLPFATSADGDDSEQGPVPLKCHVGPYGQQSMHELAPLEVLKLSSVFPEGNNNPSIVLHAGGPVWGLDWCPVSENALEARHFTQYLAVSPFPSTSYKPLIGSRVARPYSACIQIWSYGPGTKDVSVQQHPTTPKKKSPKKGKQTEAEPEREYSDDVMNAVVRCEMVLCIDRGPAHEIKWCPLPSHDKPSPRSKNPPVGKMGVLAGVFGDGSLCIYIVPDASSVRKREKTSHDEPVYIHLEEPAISIEDENATCTCLDWANSEKLAVGFSNGNVRVYDVSEALLDPELAKDLLPTHSFSVAQVFIRSITWNRTPPYDALGNQRLDRDPTVFGTVSYDGSLMATDTREGGSCVITRTRDVPYTIASGPYIGGVVTTEFGSLVKDYSLHGDMLGRGHTTGEAKGAVWNIGASDYHPYIALASTDGSCVTTNLLKPARRGSAVPILLHKIYQMDYNKTTGEYAMVENFVPYELSEGKKRIAQKAAEKNKLIADSKKPYAELDAAGQREARIRDGSGAWPVEIAVQRVAWNSGGGYGCAGLLASGMACGLVRIDELGGGGWFGGRVPYVNVQGIRGEGKKGKGKGKSKDEDEDAMDVDD